MLKVPKRVVTGDCEPHVNVLQASVRATVHTTGASFQ